MNNRINLTLCVTSKLCVLQLHRPPIPVTSATTNGRWVVLIGEQRSHRYQTPRLSLAHTISAEQRTVMVTSLHKKKIYKERSSHTLQGNTCRFLLHFIFQKCQGPINRGTDLKSILLPWSREPPGHLITLNQLF